MVAHSRGRAAPVLLAVLYAAPLPPRRHRPTFPGWTRVGINPATVLVSLSCRAARRAGLWCHPGSPRLGPDLRGALREGGRGANRQSALGARSLVVTPDGTGAGAAHRLGASGAELPGAAHVDPGYDTGTSSPSSSPRAGALAEQTASTWARFHVDFMNRLRNLPGVALVGVVENVPLNEGTQTGRLRFAGKS